MHRDTIFVTVFQLGMNFLVASPLVSWVLAQASELVREVHAGYVIAGLSLRSVTA